MALSPTETQGSIELDHRVQGSMLRRLVGREHAYDESLGGKRFFKTHVDCLPR